jgi:hypothetical protein
MLHCPTPVTSFGRTGDNLEILFVADSEVRPAYRSAPGRDLDRSRSGRPEER